MAGHLLVELAFTPSGITERRDPLGRSTGFRNRPKHVDGAGHGENLPVVAVDVKRVLPAPVTRVKDEAAPGLDRAAMVDGAYDLINEKLRPGVRENDIVADVNHFLYTHGSDDVEAVNAISGERCNPHPHNFTDRMIRPGDQCFFDILQAFMGYRTCYYRTFNVSRATPAQHDAYKLAREWLDNAIARIKPGASTAHICEVFPKAAEFGFPDELTAFGLQFAHGLGLNLHERPIISRVVSMDHPTEIKEGMVFAIETWAPATDGYSGARIEEEVVVTASGPRILTLFPASDLVVANPY